MSRLQARPCGYLRPGVWASHLEPRPMIPCNPNGGFELAKRNLSENDSFHQSNAARNDPKHKVRRTNIGAASRHHPEGVNEHEARNEARRSVAASHRSQRARRARALGRRRVHGCRLRSFRPHLRWCQPADTELHAPRRFRSVPRSLLRWSARKPCSTGLVSNVGISLRSRSWPAIQLEQLRPCLQFLSSSRERFSDASPAASKTANFPRTPSTGGTDGVLSFSKLV